MKIFVTATISLVLLIMLSILNCIFIQNTVNDLSDIIYSATGNLEDLEEAKKSLEAFSDKWESAKSLLLITISHSDTHQIDVLYQSMMDSLSTESIEDFIYWKGQLLVNLKEIAENECFSFKSII